jgi:hypothetical protein
MPHVKLQDKDLSQMNSAETVRLLAIVLNGALKVIRTMRDAGATQDDFVKIIAEAAKEERDVTPEEVAAALEKSQKAIDRLDAQVNQ